MGKFRIKDDGDFEAVKEAAEAFYKSIVAIHCPYFDGKIAFNAKGLRHLKFKGDQQARTRDDQYIRFKLLHHAPEVLRKSRTLQGIWETKKFEEQKTSSRWKSMLKEVVFYEFIAILDNLRIKVIVKEVTGGEKHFWSVIPYWKFDNENGRRQLHTGDPEND